MSHLPLAEESDETSLLRWSANFHVFGTSVHCAVGITHGIFTPLACSWWSAGVYYKSLLHLYVLQITLETVQNSSFVAAAEALKKVCNSNSFKSVRWR